MSYYKYCLVPCFTNTSVNSPDKMFITVPSKPAERKKWLTSIRRDLKKEPLSDKSVFFVCEDHFDVEKDIVNIQYVRFFQQQGRRVLMKLKPGVLPHKFDCQKDRLVTGKTKISSEHREGLALKRACLERKQLVRELIQSTSADNVPPQGDVPPQDDVPTQDNIPTQDDIPTQDNEDPPSCLIQDPSSEQSEDILHDIGIQVQPSTSDKGVQYRVPFRSRGAQTKPVKTTSTLSSPVKFPQLPPAENPRRETSSSNSSEPANSDVDFIAQSLSSSSLSSTAATTAEEAHKAMCLAVALRNAQINTKLYLGITKECYFVVTLLNNCTGISERDILITLKKLRCNHQFSIIAADFGTTEANVSLIFKKTLPLITCELKKLIYWPQQDTISLNLPIPFRKNYKSVVSIIDCFEIQIEKLSNPYRQSLTWSQYYNCNTFKYLISCTPNGFVSFISSGYGGRITDHEIVTESGYLNFLCFGNQIMADRGFKHLSATLDKLNVTLVRPPSVFAGKELNKEEVQKSKEIASLRVHVERVIGRLREFKFVTPHATVDNKLIAYLDLAVQCIAGLINLQSLIL